MIRKKKKKRPKLDKNKVLLAKCLLLRENTEVFFDYLNFLKFFHACSKFGLKILD